MLLILGDTHSLSSLLKLIKDAPENSTTIGVGDHGEGFIYYRKEENILDQLHNHLLKYNKFLYLVRGNHSDPKHFKPNHFHNLKYSNIQFVEDYTYLNIEGKTILMVGGAISIDRFCRRAYVDYWPDEGFIYNENKILDLPVDVLITHSSGKNFPPYIQSPFFLQCAEEERKRKGTDFINECDKEREDIQKLINTVKPKRYYYGHFHSHMMGEYEGIFYRCLAENELCGVPDEI